MPGTPPNGAWHRGPGSPAVGAAGETAEQVDYRWTFARPADGVLTLDGEIYGSRLWVEMKARDPGEFLLVRRGFRWVNEQPFNR